MTINVRGIKGKIKDLELTLLTHNTHIAGITETYLEPEENIYIPGYTWIGKPRTENGGGVGFMIRNDLINKIDILDENPDTEIQWIKTKTKPGIMIGVYYGKQENVKRNIIKNEIKNIENTIRKYKKDETIIMGDFNAKLEITKEMCTQTESRNGKALQSLIGRNRMEAINRLETHTGTWTRINTQNPDEKSIIDYIIITQPVTELIIESETDTNMMYKIAGKNPTDHRAITATTAINRENQKQNIRTWKKGTTQQWEAFNS